MKWVTWEKVGVDRMGSAWLIKNFIDPTAEFSFINSGEKIVPERAEPFDIPGVRLSHRRGHATFHTILRDYNLKDPTLERIARMIDEVDEVQEVMLEPAAPGLELICQGLSLTSPDDKTALERGMLVFSGLYAQIKSEIH